MPVVKMPNGDLVNFPDDMPKEKISAFIATRFPDEVKAHLDEAASAVKSGMSWSQVAGKALENAPSSAGEFIKNTAQPFIHPVETAENVGAIGKGVLQKLGVMSGKDSEQYADAVGKFFKDRYGGMDAIKKTLATDPVGALADVATILTAGGSAAARAPGIVGKAGEIAGQVGRAVDPINAVAATARGAGKLAAEGSGIATGVGSDAVKVAAKAGAEGGEAGRAFLENLTGAADPNAVVSEAKNAVSQIRQERGNVYRAEMGKIGADNTVLDFSKIEDAVNKVSGVKTYKGQVISAKTDAVRQAITDAVEEWKNLPAGDFHTAEGLDALKQKIGAIRDGTQYGTPDRLVADNVYKAVYKTITEQAPEYAKVMKGYEEASNLIKEMEKTLSLNPKASIDTTLRKLTSVLRNNVSTNYGRRAELVDFLQRAGAPHLMQKIAGQMLSSASPRGLGRVLSGGEGVGALAALAHGNPAVAAALVGGIGASSPLLAGGAAYGAGAATRLPLRQLGRSAFQVGRQEQ